MNQPVNFSKKYRRSRLAEGQEAKVRRPTLTSIKCSEQPGPESPRVRLIQQLTEPVPRDFTAYFHSSAEHNSDPTYGVTSHHTREPLPRRRTVVPAYPCIQSLRWNPYVETSSIEEKMDIPEEPEFNCKCDSCTSKKCPSRDPSSTTIRPQQVFKDNIMTFCDRHTMTPKLNEVGCGSTPVPSARVSDVSVTASNIAVKDTQASIQIQRLYNPEQCPASILKKNEREYPKYLHCWEKAYIPINSQEPERDMGDECFEPSEIGSLKTSFSCKKNKECSREPRRNIYNEGISDNVANHFPIRPSRVPSPISLQKEASKMSVRSKCCVDEGIPFSHRSDSRYHQHCRSSYSTSYYDSDLARHLVASPGIARRTYASKPMKYPKLPIIRMPKKVLTSERDIESYIDRGPALTSPCRRPRGNS